MKRNEVRDKIASLPNGTIYSVTFTKKDGTQRLMNSIKGTSKGVNGVGAKYDAEAKGLIPVYDLQLRKQGVAENKCWRNVNVETVSKIVVNKEEFLIED